jgi:hypothetical protein
VINCRFGSLSDQNRQLITFGVEREVTYQRPWSDLFPDEIEIDSPCLNRTDVVPNPGFGRYLPNQSTATTVH